LAALTERFSGGKTLSLRTLFRDEQRKIVDLILKESLATAAAAYRSNLRKSGSVNPLPK